jgi:hypothetical protein
MVHGCAVRPWLQHFELHTSPLYGWALPAAWLAGPWVLQLCISSLILYPFLHVSWILNISDALGVASQNFFQ